MTDRNGNPLQLGPPRKTSDSASKPFQPPAAANATSISSPPARAPIKIEKPPAQIEEEKKREAAAKAKAESEATAAAAKAKAEAEAKAKAKAEVEAQAKAAAEAKAKEKAEAEEKAKKEAEERAKKEAEEKAKREAEEKAKKEAEEKAKREAEEKAKREAEEKAKREAEEKAKREAEEKAKREAEEKKAKAEAQAKKEAETKAAQATTEGKDKEPKKYVLPFARANEEKPSLDTQKASKDEEEEDEDETDDWEMKDDDELTDLEGNKKESRSSSNPSVQQSSNFDKKMYERDFLLAFQSKCLQKPEGLKITMDELMGTSNNSGGGRDRGGDRGGGGGGGRDGWRNSSRGGGRQSSRSGPGRDGFHPGGGRGSPGDNKNLRRSGSRSNRAGNKNAQPNLPPVAPLAKSSNRWTPTKGKQLNDDEIVVRKVKGLLNKITIENFDKITGQIATAGIDNVNVLRSVIELVYEKAVLEPKFSTMYADLCRFLSRDVHVFEAKPEGGEDTPPKQVSFKRLLLNRCQEEFERTPDKEEWDKLSDMEKVEEDRKMRLRMKGNVKFIGELYKVKLLSVKIMHECIHRLLADIVNPEQENIEALCELLRTIGKLLDTDEAKKYMDEYFARMVKLSTLDALEPRVRFMVKDILELRGRAWVPRRKADGPKSIKEVSKPW